MYLQGSTGIILSSCQQADVRYSYVTYVYRPGVAGRVGFDETIDYVIVSINRRQRVTGLQLSGSDGRSQRLELVEVFDYWRSSNYLRALIAVRSIPASVQYGIQSPGVDTKHLLLETVRCLVLFASTVSIFTSVIYVVLNFQLFQLLLKV